MTRVSNDLWMMSISVGPLGFFILLMGFARLRSHVCVACGYSLRGLKPGARCPECGGLWPVHEGPEVDRSPWLMVLGCVLMALAAAPVVIGIVREL